ncbi:hypothetical protein NQ318_009091 [Aromia moschata]|uniref:Uncharacterized protein n=1 Tax=Aromia moschata TaxID=1265417 RepID=A0AAV8YT67_9CUCU|nr:hypothetical protein NQ318_009091 [Aromia moschata]
MESVRKYKDVKLVTRLTQFGDDMVIIEMRRLKVKFNKPIYVGFSILDLSKIILYDFHYDYVKREFDVNIYELMKKDIHLFDTSDYPANNVYGIPQAYKKVLGLMKDENHGEIMTEFIGLRAKMYTYKVNHESVYKRIKGLSRPAIKRITFEDFRNCLFNQDTVNKEQKLIRSQKHTLYTIKQKIGSQPRPLHRYISAIRENTHQTIDTILEKIVIPDRAIYWLALYRNDDILLFRKFITKQIQIDIFINQLDEIFNKGCFSTLSLYTIKQVVKRHYPLRGSFYRLYLTKLLIGKDDYLQIDHLNKYYPSINISLNYKNIDWSLDKAICEAVYFTQHYFLENIYRLWQASLSRYQKARGTLAKMKKDAKKHDQI